MRHEEALAYSSAFDANPARFKTLVDAFEEIRVAHSLWQQVPRSDPRALKQAAAKVMEIRIAQRNAFARERGWRVARSFSLEQLKAGRMIGRGWRGMYGYPEMDHPEFFAAGRRPAAILSHSYAPWDGCAKYARAHGLHVEPLPYSWYFPLHALAVLYTRHSD